MAINRVLLPLTDASTASSAIETGIAATQILEGKIDALFIENGVSRIASTRPPPGVAPTEWQSAMTAKGETDAGGPEQAEGVGDKADQTREQFRQACSEAGITLVKTDESGERLAASWHEVLGSPRKLVAEQAALDDLVVSPGTSGNGEARPMVEAALLRVGCPVLLAPSRVTKAMTDTVVIAWEDSPQCWAAVEAALPFLAAAQSIFVVTVDKDRDRPRASQQRLLDYLGERGIEAEAKVVDPLSRPIGQAILSEATDRGAGLLVMGAYSRSPLREALFGGATREVLKHAAATPVLMAH